MEEQDTEFFEVAPHPLLADFVEHYWELKNPSFGAGHPIFPRGSLDLIFNLSGNSGYEKVLRPSFTNGRTDLQDTTDWLSGYGVKNQTVKNVWFSGLHDRSIIVRTPYADSKKGVHLLAAKLKPISASLLLGVQATQLTNAVINAVDLFGHEIVDLYDELGNMPNATTRFELLDQYLRNLAVPRLRSVSRLASSVAKVIEQSEGLMSVAALCSEFGVSRKHLADISKKYIGMTPKRYMRLTRFRAVSEKLMSVSGQSVAETALEFGYADQSHLINEFVEFTGFTPGQVLP